MKKKISIIGCGWLGMPLALSLSQNRYSVSGLTRNLNRLDCLKKSGVETYSFSVFDELSNYNASFFLADIIIITLPFKRSFEDPFIYYRQIEWVLSQIKKTTQVIFTSTTSIYSKNSGIYTEKSTIVYETDRIKALYYTEQLILNTMPNSSVLRLAGLYGPEREIGKSFFKKKVQINGNVTVNLVHLDDVIAVIHTIISRQIYKPILNVVSSRHPLKKDLYKPFLTDTIENGIFIERIIDNSYLKKCLNYDFIHELGEDCL